jgi:beta-carotene 3-hydroxylase
VSLLVNLALFLVALVGMEGVAWWTHKYVMHGPLWSLHRSHHAPRTGVFELKDLFAVLFALPSIVLIAVGTWSWRPALWLGLGMTTYGALYALFHDGLVHRRFALPFPRALLRRQLQAHRVHHAIRTKNGAVSFGFLAAPSPRRLKRQMQALRTGGA